MTMMMIVIKMIMTINVILFLNGKLNANAMKVIKRLYYQKHLIEISPYFNASEIDLILMSWEISEKAFHFCLFNINVNL